MKKLLLSLFFFTATYLHSWTKVEQFFAEKEDFSSLIPHEGFNLDYSIQKALIELINKKPTILENILYRIKNNKNITISTSEELEELLEFIPHSLHYFGRLYIVLSQYDTEVYTPELENEIWNIIFDNAGKPISFKEKEVNSMLMQKYPVIKHALLTNKVEKELAFFIENSTYAQELLTPKILTAAQYLCPHMQGLLINTAYTNPDFIKQSFKIINEIPSHPTLPTYTVLKQLKHVVAKRNTVFKNLTFDLPMLHTALENFTKTPVKPKKRSNSSCKTVVIRKSQAH